MARKKIRFGILGCANIARKVSRAILISPNSTISAIGSRSIDKATRFASENNFPASAKVYGSYGDVLEDPNVDGVYIPLPTSLHLEWAILAAKKKKHVLLEKPVALNIAQLDAILEACESNGVQYMDATMWMHHPRTLKMREFLSDSQRFGQLKAVHSIFSYTSDLDFYKSDVRVNPNLDALGALGDAGWYCIRAILWSKNYDLPKTVTAHPNPEFNERGVIMSCGATLCFNDGTLATFHCSFHSNLTMDITCLGTKGTLHVHDFVIPFKEDVGRFQGASGTRFAELSIGIEQITSDFEVMTEIPQEAKMVTEFSRLVDEIEVNGAKPEQKWVVISRKTQAVVDAVKGSIEQGFKELEVMY